MIAENYVGMPIEWEKSRRSTVINQVNRDLLLFWNNRMLDQLNICNLLTTHTK